MYFKPSDTSSFFVIASSFSLIDLGAVQSEVSIFMGKAIFSKHVYDPFSLQLTDIKQLPYSITAYQ